MFSVASYSFQLRQLVAAKLCIARLYRAIGLAGSCAAALCMREVPAGNFFCLYKRLPARMDSVPPAHMLRRWQAERPICTKIFQAMCSFHLFIKFFTRSQRFLKVSVNASHSMVRWKLAIRLAFVRGRKIHQQQASAGRQQPLKIIFVIAKALSSSAVCSIVPNCLRFCLQQHPHYRDVHNSLY